MKPTISVDSECTVTDALPEFVSALKNKLTIQNPKYEAVGRQDWQRAVEAATLDMNDQLRQAVNAAG